MACKRSRVRISIAPPNTIMKVQHFFDKDTATLSYVVSDENSKMCAIIDSVMGYDIYSGKTNDRPALEIVNYVKENNLQVQWIIDTHIHADHLTASKYLKEILGGKIAISRNITKVLEHWVDVFDIYEDTPLDGSQFDYLFDDNEDFKIGNINAHTISTPGHTPACMSYLIGDSIFVGDTIFMPYLGTARTDFPGGSAEVLYDSIQKINKLSPQTKIYVGHDYPQDLNNPKFSTTIGQQIEENILVNKNINKKTYVDNRNKRDEGKAVPKLIFPAIQFNLRAGSFGSKSKNGKLFIKTPINIF